MSDEQPHPPTVTLALWWKRQDLLCVGPFPFGALRKVGSEWRIVSMWGDAEMLYPTRESAQAAMEAAVLALCAP
jgi:hypothetical protein